MNKLLKTVTMAVILIGAANFAAYADTFNVTNLDDSGAGSLRQAITDANAAAGYDVINFSVTGTVLLASALPTINDSVSINGSGQNTLVIDGQNVSAVRPFNINAPGIVVSIRDLTVTRGVGTSSGGGIRIDGGATVTLTNVTVTQNAATGGGGINVSGASTLYLINSLITNNTVSTSGGDGGGVNVTSSVMLMRGTTVSGNLLQTTGSATGGGINIVTSSAMGSPVSFVRIENSTVNNNSAQLGGGVYCSGGSTLRMSNATVSSNTTVTTDATVANGAGVYLNLGTGIIRNSTIAGNNATGTGAGGGIYATGAGSATIGNTIVADNTAGNAASMEIRGTTTAGGTTNTRGINIIEGTTSGTITVQNGSNITGVDPQLGALANNSGQVQTQAISTASNAYNAALNSESLDSQDNLLTVDARGSGFSRIVSGTADIGAFEFTTSSQLNRNTFDFDGDGRADFSVYRPSEGNWYGLRSGAANAFSATTFGLSSDLIAPADFDGDGKSDSAVFRDGSWFILSSETGQVRFIDFGQSGDLPRPGDFDGDGRADIGIFRPSTGSWFYLSSSDEQLHGGQFGQAGDRPMIGDFDGDGRTDIAVYRPSQGNWYYLRSSDSQASIQAFGLPDDIPLNGDFNGDGKSDLAVYRPSTGFWYVARPTGIPAQNFDALPFGLSTDIPVPADYDGDGRADIAVFRPSNGVWYVMHSSTGQVNYVNFGINTDRPTAAAYAP